MLNESKFSPLSSELARHEWKEDLLKQQRKKFAPKPNQQRRKSVDHENSNAASSYDKSYKAGEIGITTKCLTRSWYAKKRQEWLNEESKKFKTPFYVCLPAISRKWYSSVGRTVQIP